MKVIVTVVPMAGHVGPISGLVAELVRRGHDVRVYTGSRYRQRFTDLGARVITWSAAQEYDEHDLGASWPAARRPGFRRGIALVCEGFIGTAPGQVQDLNEELDREPTDVLVADPMSFGGVLTAELCHLPWAMLNVLPFNQGFESAPAGFNVKPARGALGRQRDRLLWSAYRTMTSPIHRAYNRARAAVGLPRDPRPYGRALFSDWLVLATGCPGLDVPRQDLPDVVHFVGRVGPAGSDLPQPTEAQAAGGLSTRPLILLTQGTSDLEHADLLQPALLGLADLDVDVLATSGQRGRTQVGVAPPANARVVDLVDFATILPKTAVMVTNGGWGGVLASLAAGVPLVVAPGGAADKPEIAARVAQFGVGVNLRKRRVKAEAVAHAVSEVLGESEYRERAREIAEELGRLGGVNAAADLLERLVESGAPVRRIGSPWSGSVPARNPDQP